MRKISRFSLAALLVTAVAGLAGAQSRDGANKPTIGPLPSAPSAASTDTADKAAQKTTRASLYRPFEINHPRRGPARRQRLRSAER